MTERELLRLHIEAGWNLTLPALEETTQDFVFTQSLPPWSLYLGTLAEVQVALWHPQVPPDQRLLLRTEARQAGVVWDQAVQMRRELVFHYPSFLKSNRRKPHNKRESSVRTMPISSTLLRQKVPPTF